MNRSFHSVRLVCFIAFSLSPVCCDKGENPPEYSPPNDIRGIIPLGIGRSWTYRTISVFVGPSYDTTIESIQIIDTPWVDGQEQFEYRGSPPHLFSNGSGYRETLDSADYSLYLLINCLGTSIGKTDSQPPCWLPLHILKTPLSKGHQWRTAEWDSLYGYDFGTVTIMNPDTTVELGIGRFDHAIDLFCTTGGVQSYRFIIVPGIGVVQQSAGFLDSGFKKDLIEWSIK
jgi:hypothetical protein